MSDCDTVDVADAKAEAFEGHDFHRSRGGGTRGGRPQPRSTTRVSSAAPAAPTSEVLAPPDAGRFATVEDVIDRVMWDTRFNADDVTVGYEDRFSDELVFTPVVTFRSRKDVTIPLHRVQQLKHCGQVIYDRKRRINLLGDVAPATTQPPEDSLQEAPVRRPRKEVQPNAPVDFASALRFVKGYSLHVSRATAPPLRSVLVDALPSRLKVLNFNLLHDLFDAELIYTEERLPLICDLLESVDADIVFLQEGTAKFVNYLRSSSPLLCARYDWTTIPSDSQTVQVTLSKFPIVSATSHALSRNKRCVFTLHQLTSTECVVAANCHLLSDFGTDPVNRRLGEMKTIFELLNKAKAVCGARLIMSGDFNFGDQNPEQRIADWNDFADSWLEVQGCQRRFDPDETVINANETPATASRVGGFTYDLTANWLADAQSRAHRYPRRLDRTLLRGLRPLECEIVGNKPVQRQLGDALRPLFPSDHFGLVTVCDFEHFVPSAVTTAPPAPVFVPPPPWFRSSPALTEAVADTVSTPYSPFFRSALVVLIPDKFVSTINHTRQRYDKAYPRWMPHITLMFPFVDPRQFESAISAIQRAMAVAPPSVVPSSFQLSLAKTGSFDGKKCVLFVDPTDPATGNASTSLQSLYYFLQPLFPTLVRQDREGPLKPHSTLGHCALQQKTKILQDFSDKWKSTFTTPSEMEFTVTHFALIAHLDGKAGFEVIHRFDLPRS